jgi:hypothetical protein
MLTGIAAMEIGTTVTAMVDAALAEMLNDSRTRRREIAAPATPRPVATSHSKLRGLARTAIDVDGEQPFWRVERRIERASQARKALALQNGTVA